MVYVVYDNCCHSHYDFNFVTFTVVLFTDLGQNHMHAPHLQRCFNVYVSNST